MTRGIAPDDEVVVTHTDAEHEDPAIAALLALLARDIEAERNARGMPEELTRPMLEHVDYKVDLGDDFDEEVEICTTGHRCSHDNLIDQMMKLRIAVLRAQESDPERFRINANIKLFQTAAQLIQDVVTSNPACDEYRQNNIMGRTSRHGRRARLERRYRLLYQ